MTTEQEVWLRAYCTALGTASKTLNEPTDVADACLKDFRERFADDLPAKVSMGVSQPSGLASPPSGPFPWRLSCDAKPLRCSRCDGPLGSDFVRISSDEATCMDCAKAQP